MVVHPRSFKVVPFHQDTVPSGDRITGLRPRNTLLPSLEVDSAASQLVQAALLCAGPVFALGPSLELLAQNTGNERAQVLVLLA